MEGIVGGEELVALHRPIAAAEIGDEATGFLDQQHAGGDVPRLEPGFPVTVDPPPPPVPPPAFNKFPKLEDPPLPPLLPTVLSDVILTPFVPPAPTVTVTVAGT